MAASQTSPNILRRHKRHNRYQKLNSAGCFLVSLSSILFFYLPFWPRLLLCLNPGFHHRPHLFSLHRSFTKSTVQFYTLFCIPLNSAQLFLSLGSRITLASRAQPGGGHPFPKSERCQPFDFQGLRWNVRRSANYLGVSLG